MNLSELNYNTKSISTYIWPSEEKQKEKTLHLASSSKALTRFNPYRPFYSKVDVACKKSGVLDYSYVCRHVKEKFTL